MLQGLAAHFPKAVAIKLAVRPYSKATFTKGAHDTLSQGSCGKPFATSGLVAHYHEPFYFFFKNFSFFSF